MSCFLQHRSVVQALESRHRERERESRYIYTIHMVLLDIHGQIHRRVAAPVSN